MIKLFYSKDSSLVNGNFGDELSPLIVSEITGQEVVYADVRKCDLVALGSVLDKFGVRRLSKVHRYFQRISKLKIWGSGLMYDQAIKFPINIDFISVRGKFTRSRIDRKGSTGIGLGDPGLLAPYMFPEEQPIKHRIGLIPHFVDHKNKQVKEIIERLHDVHFINVLDPVRDVIKQIKSCEVILSSSLHGLIVADSFGIPNQWLEFSDKVQGAGFKFKDYFSSLGQDHAPINLMHESIQAINVEKIIENYSVDDTRLSAIKESLITSLRESF